MSTNMKSLKNYELRTLAEELDLDVPDNAKIIDLKNLIENSDVFKNEQEFVHSVICTILEERKTKATEDQAKLELQQLKASENQAKLELEKLKLAQLERKIELANIRKEFTPNQNDEQEILNRSIESILKSIKTLNIPVAESRRHGNIVAERVGDLAERFFISKKNFRKKLLSRKIIFFYRSV